MLRMRPENKYWSLHTHSRYSNNDALPEVTDMVAHAAYLGQPALGIQDHGNMAASVELYQACKRAGIAPFPGTEMYMVPSISQYKADRANKAIKASMYHLGVTATTRKGYENLVRLNTTAHKQHFFKPLVDFTTLAGMSEDDRFDGLVVNTGCYFGYLVQQLTQYGMRAAEQWLNTLALWFPESVYVELQNHGIDHEDGWNDAEVADCLLELADRCGLPAIVTQDSHYIAQDDKAVHETLKQLVAWGDNPDDAVFPGDGFHMADHAWMEAHHPPERLGRGLEGLEHLRQRHAVSIPVLDTYSYAVPELVKSPQAVLATRVTDRLKSMGLGPRYDKRLAAELKVIGVAEMAGYMLLTADICDWMRDHDILFQARGSSAGSLVCWLLGISNVDPIKWDLRFERFLSTDRTKPPDIDLDVEHTRRQEIIDWLRTKYAVHQIGTWMQYALAKNDEGKGSLMVKYFTAAAKQNGPKVWSDIPLEDQDDLKRLASYKPFSGRGKNAAGIVITAQERDFSRLVPLHHSTSGEPLSQYSKEDIESLGLVKLDLLGSKTLTVIHKALLLIGNKQLLEEVPLNDNETFKFIRTGQVDGIFTIEGSTCKRGLPTLKPTTVHHIIAAMALYRPAIMRSGGTDAYVRRKNREEDTPSAHELIEQATAKTHGIVLYQEQVMDLMRSLGMGIEDLNKFLKAVKASNKDIGDAGKVIHTYMDWLRTTCVERGMTDAEVDWVVNAVTGFAEYSFNRAHATVYGITAYYCAYLAVHYPLEFHTALLSVAAGDKQKEPKYLRAARSRAIRVRKPDVNLSGESYTLDRRHGVIRKGLSSVNGVGSVGARELAAKQPYTSLDDLIQRVEPRRCSGGKDYLITKNIKDLSGTLLNLHENGVLDSIMNHIAD